ncbi:hypothetical protein Tco_0246051 [Tanacetum coccineum]
MRGLLCIASPEVKIADDSVDDIVAKNLVYIRRSAAKTKDKGKGVMDESESAGTKTKRQQEQEILGLETAMRLQEEFDKEERQRIAIVHEAARYYNKEEWKDIKARVESFEELVQRLQTKEREKYSEDDQAKMLQLKRLSFDEIKDLFENTMRRANTFVPIETEIRRGVPKDDLLKLWSLVQERFNSTKPIKDKEIEIWVELKTLVHHVSTKDGVDIYMLVEREYPLSRGVLTQMLVAKLLVEQNNEISRELLRKIFMQVERPRI